MCHQKAITILPLESLSVKLEVRFLGDPRDVTMLSQTPARFAAIAVYSDAEDGCIWAITPPNKRRRSRATVVAIPRVRLGVETRERRPLAARSRAYRRP